MLDTAESPVTVDIFDCVSAALEADASSLADSQVTVLMEQCPVYATLGIPVDSLRTEALRNVGRAVSALRKGSAPRPEDVTEAWIARERADQGMTTGDMLDASRLAYRVIRDAFVTLACDFSPGPLAHEALVRGICILTDTAEAVASQLYAVRRELELARRRCSERERTEFVRALLHSELDLSAITEQAPLYGLTADQRYLAVRAHPGETQVEVLRAALHRSDTTTGRASLLVSAGTELIGVIPTMPDAATVPTDTVVAIGSARTLSEIGQSFRTASRVLETARRFHLGGLVRADDLGLRIAVTADPELSGLFVRRYLAPLAAEAEFGSVLRDSVREYLRSGGQIKRAARHLGIHTNTLKHRLARFQQVTGSDLENPRMLTELWWALEAEACGATTPDG